MVKHRDKTNTYLDNKAQDESRYILSNVYVDTKIRSGVRKYGKWKIPDIDESNKSDWVKHTVTRYGVNRIDLIANEYYRNVRYWWAICIVNGISNPWEEIEIGQILYIPPLANIIDAMKE